MSHADSQSTKITRRRFLTVIAATGAAPLIGVQPAYAAGRFHEWSGTALGAEASMRLWHADAALAQQTIAASVVDLDRMENIFSLFRDASQISRLNRHGALVNPAPELVDVLRQAARLSDKSGGSFDVTVQPLWRLFEAHFRRQPNDVVGPSAADIATAVAHIDYRNLTIAAERIGFDQPGMAITLNGIAQGYV
ncbi:MAG: FAD:protein FMN transferase, partial [Alphaproteobacteria bacterium]|nr:FAD:protein FMN transferase [Alphaproteobacteria bacterium]